MKKGHMIRWMNHSAVLLAALLLAACAGAPLAPSETPPPPAALAPLPAGQPDDQTQVRLRVNNCVFNGPDLELSIGGRKVDYGGVEMPKLPPLGFSGYIYLPPAKVTLSLSAGAGGGVFAGPLDLALSAGHRYTLVVMGQAGETSHPLLVIDETAAYQALGGSGRDTRFAILVNNLKSSGQLTYTEGSQDRIFRVSPASFKAGLLQNGRFAGQELSLFDGQKTILDQAAGYEYHIEGLDDVTCVGGVYPGALSTDFDYQSSQLNGDLTPLETLTRITAGKNQSFQKFLAIIQAANLAGLFSKGGPYLVFAPADPAFSSLAPSQVEHLMKDPGLAADFVKRHIVQGFYPWGSLAGSPPETGRTLRSLLGNELKIEGETMKRVQKQTLKINGVVVGTNLDMMLAGGTRLRLINEVIPEK